MKFFFGIVFAVVFSASAVVRTFPTKVSVKTEMCDRYCGAPQNLIDACCDKKDGYKYTGVCKENGMYCEYTH